MENIPSFRDIWLLGIREHIERQYIASTYLIMSTLDLNEGESHNCLSRDCMSRTYTFPSYQIIYIYVSSQITPDAKLKMSEEGVELQSLPKYSTETSNSTVNPPETSSPDAGSELGIKVRYYYTVKNAEECQHIDSYYMFKRDITVRAAKKFAVDHFPTFVNQECDFTKSFAFKEDKNQILDLDLKLFKLFGENDCLIITNDSRVIKNHGLVKLTKFDLIEDCLKRIAALLFLLVVGYVTFHFVWKFFVWIW